MPLTVPAAPKVRTTRYDNFKGVDFTNDSTNVWYRRSPDAVNMLPDESGRPFKRTGWEVISPIEDMISLLSDAGITVESLEILKCHYFELAGIDHVFIFTDGGVFSYKNDVLTLQSADIDCYSSYDRAFFFEGNGKASFYIYGNYKVWVYGYDVETESFTFSQVSEGLDEDKIKIPRIIIGASPECVGTMLESYNLLGNKASVEYESNDMFYAYSTGDFSVSADRTTFTTALSTRNEYTFTYDETSDKWTLTYGSTTVSNLTTANLESTYGIKMLGTPDDNEKIVVLYIYGVLLPNNVIQKQLSDVAVYGTTLQQFDTPLTVKESNESLTDNTECRLKTDLYSKPESNRKAWIQFYNAYPLVTTNEDCIKVVFPIKMIDITNYPISGHENDCISTDTATLNT